MITAFPQYLWLLPLAPVMAAACWRWRAGPRRRLVAVLRGVCVATIVLALAEPMLRTRVATRTHVTVLDLGPTIPGPTAGEALERLQGRPAGDSRVVVFSNRAELLTVPLNLGDPGQLATLRGRLARPVATDDLKTGGSALAAALQLAGAQIAPDGHGDIELLSNGLATRGDAEAEAYRLATRGIAVRVAPEAVSPAGDIPAVVRVVRAPASAGAGETVTVGVVVEAAQACDGVLTLASSGSPVSSRVRLSSGDQTVRLSVPMGAPGLTSITATVVVDGHPASAAVVAAVDVRPGVRVLMVRQEDSGAAADALGMLLGRGARVECIAPGELAGHPLDGYGAVVLADVPADALTGDAQQRIRDAVLNGTGLLLTGAARSFGPGGYEESPLGSLLPVKMPQQAESIDPSTTLVLIIDTSGSMQEFQRMDLAKEVAHLAISHLKPHDKVGIVEFYGGKRWAAPIQSAANTAAIGRALSRLTAGGGTTLYPAVEEAAFALGNIDTQSKHVLIISDGGVESAPFAPLLRQMSEDGIAVSGVGVAPTAGEPNMMPDIAHWGGGRYYSVPDRFAVPDITLKRPQVSLLSPVVRAPAKLVADDDALVRGADVETWAPVNGYVRTVARPTADVLLRTTAGDPLLVRWRYGAGFVAAMPTQLGSEMTRSLQGDTGFAKLVAGLFRQIAPDHRGTLDVQPLVRPAGVEVNVTARDRDESVPDGQLQLTLADVHGRVVRSITAEAVDRGRWNVLLPGVTDGRYRVRATVAGTSAAGEGGLSVIGPRVVPRLTPDLDLLDRITAFHGLATERAARLPPTIESFTGLRSELVALAVLVFLFEIAARRYPERVRQAS